MYTSPETYLSSSSTLKKVTLESGHFDSLLLHRAVRRAVFLQIPRLQGVSGEPALRFDPLIERCLLLSASSSLESPFHFYDVWRRQVTYFSRTSSPSHHSRRSYLTRSAPGRALWRISFVSSEPGRLRGTYAPAGSSISKLARERLYSPAMDRPEGIGVEQWNWGWSFVFVMNALFRRSGLMTPRY